MLLCMVVGVDVGLWLWPDHLSPHGGLAAHYSPLPCQTHSHHQQQQQQEERELGSGSISRARCALDTLEGTSAQEEEGGGNTSGNCGEKSEREENAEKGTYCQRLLWLRRRNKVVVVLLELHQEVHLAAGRCQKGKFGSDRCTQGGGGGGRWTHLLPAKKWGQRIQFWGSAVHNKERCQPSDFSPLQHWNFGRGGGNVYIRDPDLYRAAWFLALPNPMNRVLLLIYPKHQISPLL